ncbi:hypothetical protein [Dinghuibacter silviterrae]|uniref:Dolichyl-phosphate-mannose-protein mannosyltransferase n=1 Tax=Dinghuibacter silviterrae TaxID=1539049 RepID=A0A4R8DX92_9BACT|nr:hypothetical protein [Dinghuibacter silviterrae]TDX01831.1 hypothetical protein EDB95_2874 [Dinghuibacter silviterrae]
MNNHSAIPALGQPKHFKLELETVGKFSISNSLLSFIWQSKENRLLLFLLPSLSAVQFIIFKLFYPFPDFSTDGYNYLYAAYANLDVNIWPIGYSKFLLLIHKITSNDTALVAIQYFILELSALYLFFSWRYFFGISNLSRNLLIIFLIFNPLFLYISNFVSSDALFATLSLFWFTELFWVIFKPTAINLLAQGILLFLCFTVRNSAYYYPIITVIAFLISQSKVWVKVTGLLIGPLLILPFFLHTRSVAKQMTGTAQYSLFTGWQLANNALYIWEYADTNKTLDPECKKLDQMSRAFYSTGVPDNFEENHLSRYVGNYFIREPISPLKKYLYSHYHWDNDYSGIVAWGKVSAIFYRYGRYLILQNPRAYLWEFAIPNTKFYFFPPLEKLSEYNLRLDKIEPIAQYWFKYKSTKISAASKDIQNSILKIFPILFCVLNIFFLGGVVLAQFKQEYRIYAQKINKAIIIISMFLFANFFFSIFVTIDVFRYQFFPMLVLLFGATLIIDFSGKSTHMEPRTLS